jgi:hypothetical protein
LAAVRLHSRHRVIGRRRLSEAPLARMVRSNDILQVADAAGDPVDAGDHQHIPFSQEIEHGAQLRALVPDLFSDRGATLGATGGLLISITG